MGETMGKIRIFRKVNSKCQIKGCRSNGRKVDTFYVSASEGYGPSAILCRDCIESLYERLNGVQSTKCKVQNEEEATVLTTEEPAEEEEAVDRTPEKAKKARSKKAE